MVSEVSEQNERNAARDYYENWAGPVVTNTRLFVACMALSVVCLLLGGLLVDASYNATHQKIVILQRSADGALDRAQYVDMGAYQPGEKEIEHFGYKYVVATYSRVRATLASDFVSHLAFLPSEQRRTELANETQTKWIEGFVRSFDPEVRINVVKVRYGGGASHRMSVDFEKRFSLAGRETQHAENWTVEMVFGLSPDGDISGDLIPVNPLGMTITEARESKGF